MTDPRDPSEIARDIYAANFGGDDAMREAIAAAIRAERDASRQELDRVRAETWREAIEAAARVADGWTRPSAIRLRAGEMTAQELRSALAVVKSIDAAIRALAPPASPQTPEALDG